MQQGFFLILDRSIGSNTFLKSMKVITASFFWLRNPSMSVRSILAKKIEIIKAIQNNKHARTEPDHRFSQVCVNSPILKLDSSAPAQRAIKN